MPRRLVIFHGRVQGVGFRATTTDVAKGFRVTGWVRNEQDDTVRLEVQGDAGEVRAMLAELRVRMGRFIFRETEDELPEDPDERAFQILR